jgi:DNA-binding response OmpR family regulator
MRRVLVVDDEPHIRAVLRGYLEADGFAVSEAADGEEAVRRVRQDAPDLVLLDVMLPGIDGIEALRQVRTFSDVYVIVVTARTEEVDKLVGLSALEFDLLAALAEAPGRVFSRRQLLERVWGYDFFGDERVVDVHIRSLRARLGDDAANPRLIATVRGVGYKFTGRPI